MDIQRIVLFAGLAIVSYMMVLAWNEDYNQPQTQPATEQASTSTQPASTDDMTLPSESASGPDTSSEEFTTPEGDGQTISASEIGRAHV